MTITHNKQFKSLQNEGKTQKAFALARTQAVEFTREFFKANKTICIGVVGALAIMAFVIGIANIKEMSDGKAYLKSMKNEILTEALDGTNDMQALYESGQNEIIQNEIEKQLMTYIAGTAEGDLSPEELEELKQSIYSSIINNISVSENTELTEKEMEAIKLMITESVNKIDYSSINEAIENLSGEMNDVQKKADLEKQSKTKSGIFSGIWDALTVTNVTVTNNKTASEEEDKKLWGSINDVDSKLNSVFQSVSDGKTL
ncbi:MAG: hypothetical protein HUJ70_10290, partial [Pseudobutyrivibrio sp.]|nr:hypothetical protein [Pseudobutyrivibrio sp.]